MVIKDPPCEPGKRRDRIIKDGCAFIDEVLSDLPGEAGRRHNEDRTQGVFGNGPPELVYHVSQTFSWKTAVQSCSTHPVYLLRKRLLGQPG